MRSVHHAHSGLCPLLWVGLWRCGNRNTLVSSPAVASDDLGYLFKNTWCWKEVLSEDLGYLFLELLASVRYLKQIARSLDLRNHSQSCHSSIKIHTSPIAHLNFTYHIYNEI